MTQHLSHFAWAVLGQLARQSYQDGDIICKSGRDELMQLGLAERVPMYGVPHLMENRLTKKGAELAARLQTPSERAND